MLRIITGKSDTLNTGYITNLITGRSQESPDMKFFVIVPEQATLQMQQRIVRTHPSHACMNIDIVSFDRLAHVVLAKQGTDISDILGDTGMTLILKRILLREKENLSVYKNKASMTGFAEEMKSAVTEFIQYDIDDNRLFMMQESAREAGDRLLFLKLSDIRLVFREFNREIENKYTTQGAILDVFSRAVPSSSFLADCEIFLDGFTGFTPVQYRIIEKFLERKIDVSVTLTVPAEKTDPSCEPFEMFYLANESINRLKKAADNAGSGIEYVQYDKGTEFEKGTQHGEDNLSICLRCCSSPADEIKSAAGKIRKLVREEGYRYRDIAVLTTDLDGSRIDIKQIFNEADIPVFIDHKENIDSFLPVRYIFRALEAAETNMQAGALFGFLKLGLSDIPADDIARLENYCLEFNIRGINAWTHEFKKNRKLHGSDGYFWDMEYINALREQVAGITAVFVRRLNSKDLTADDCCRALADLLNGQDIRTKVINEAGILEENGDKTAVSRYSQILDKLEETLQLISKLFGGEKISVAEFREIMKSGVSETEIAVIPPTLDMCMAGDITRSRLPDVKVLFVLGANDGKLPAVREAGGLFTQRERAFLKEDFEIAPTVTEDIYLQQYYLYLCFNKPEKALFITWAQFGGDGEELRRSCILDDLETYVLGDISIESSGAPEGLWNEETLLQISGQVRDFAESGDPQRINRPLIKYFAGKDPESIRQITAGAFYTSSQTPLDSRVALDLYGGKLKGSVSRIERFYECPYKHFLNYGMRLEKRPEYEIKTTDLGTIYHGAIEKYSSRLSKEGFSFRTIDDETSHRISAECVDEQIESMDSTIFESSARNGYLRQRIGQITEKTTDVLREHVKAGLFEPVEFEYRFTDSRSFDSVTFSGVIDRVDIYDAGDIYVKIIDYKSGNKAFDITDIYNGTQLQLIAYMKEALREVKKKNPGREVHPGGVYYYLIRDNYVKDKEKQADKNRMSGLTMCDGEIPQAVDLTLEHGGVSHIIDVKYNQNGTPTASSKIACESEFYSLMDFTGKKIEEAAERILGGEVEIAPYRKGEQTGCRLCDYSDICRFENGRFGCSFREARTEGETAEKEKAEREIYGRN